ncbi:MAG TPA: G/U mismatch-specific DNA glycosylase, partial [Polyangiales bacterium]|nr:G/U mismatch-specific DNA glycosylase [Polyangiales bacterium]
MDQPDLLPDILADGLAVVFCGINPASSAAEAGHHFVSPTNRFWRVLHLAGFTPQLIAPREDRSILLHGYGLTAAVARPTRQAAELSREDLEKGGVALEAKIARHAPRAVAFLGKPAYAAITKSTQVAWGRQPASFAGSAAWVLPNPSGRNRNFSLTELVDAYAALRRELSVVQHGSNAVRAIDARTTLPTRK